MATDWTIALDFDSLAPLELPFVHKGQRYVLREASDAHVTEWQAAVIKSLIVQPDGTRIPSERTNETRLKLVAACVFSQEEGGNVKPVTLDTVKTWPHRVVADLFDKAKRLCGEHEDVDTLEGLRKRKAGIDERIAALEKAEQEAESKRLPKS